MFQASPAPIKHQSRSGSNRADFDQKCQNQRKCQNELECSSEATFRVRPVLIQATALLSIQFNRNRELRVTLSQTRESWINPSIGTSSQQHIPRGIQRGVARTFVGKPKS